jgi:predicted ribosomally synthesized peptide with SipW-like signal peptide
MLKNMNKILKSVVVIAFVAAIAVGATSAYFSDEETVSGNTITAGTIDIQLDGKDANGADTEIIPYKVADVKPGETGYMTFNIQNVGTNPVNVSKNLSNFVGTTGATGTVCLNVGSVSSEPECVAAQDLGNDANDLQTQIKYDLTVYVYADASEVTPSWWQEIYNVGQNKTLNVVYPNATTFVALGMIPVGGHMKVIQSYHFAYEAGNIYQGAVLTFDITIKGQQLTGADGYASVILEDKTAGPEYRIMTETVPTAVLKYKTTGPLFDYNLTGVVTQANTSYKLLQAKDPWPQTGSIVIATFSSDGSNNINVSGSLDTGSIANGKMWVILASDWNGTNMTAWNQPAYLLETGLVNYTK